MMNIRYLATMAIVSFSVACGAAEPYAAQSPEPSSNSEAPTAEYLDDAATAQALSPGKDTEYGVGRYPKNPTLVGTVYSPSNIAFVNKYCGRIDVSKTISSSVSATLSVSTSISASDVSAGLGFSVTGTYTVSDSFNKSIPAGECWLVTAYPTYLKYSFEIWDRNYLNPDIYVGSGFAYKPIGLFIDAVPAR